MSDEFDDIEEEINEPEVEVHMEADWSYENRLQLLIEGAMESADEIIRSLHQPMKLHKLADEKYKQATEGRSYAIQTAQDIMSRIRSLREDLDRLRNPDKGTKRPSNGKTMAEGRAE